MSDERAKLRGPSLRVLLWRGFVQRCPACGQGKLFSRWFRMQPSCPNCQLKFERIEGHWAGSLGLNTIVSFSALFGSLVVGFVVTFPEFPVAKLLIANTFVAAAVPLAFLPSSRTLWTAIDIAMRPLQATEVEWSRVS